MSFTQNACINDTILELSKDAQLGDVLLNEQGVYMWAARREDFMKELIMLTKTERGFELMDGNGRSRGIINIDYWSEKDKSCPECDRGYFEEYKAICIPTVCESDHTYFGKCEDGTIGWCGVCTCVGLTSELTYTVTTVDDADVDFDNQVVQLPISCPCEGTKIIWVGVVDIDGVGNV